MALQTKYITPDEFREYTGIDLSQHLRGQDPSSFLYRIEARMEAFLNAEYFQLVDKEYPRFTDYQKRCYKNALLEQALYVFKNGDIAVDSGYDPEKGIIASKHALGELVLSPLAKEQLMLCGLLSTKIKGPRAFYIGGWFNGY